MTRQSLPLTQLSPDRVDDNWAAERRETVASCDDFAWTRHRVNPSPTTPSTCRSLQGPPPRRDRDLDEDVVVALPTLSLPPPQHPTTNPSPNDPREHWRIFWFRFHFFFLTFFLLSLRFLLPGISAGCRLLHGCDCLRAVRCY